MALLAFLLHFVWEFWQVPWYQGMNDLPHLAGVLMCSRAAAGDAVIALAAYAGPALMARSRFWARDASLRLLAAYLGIGLTITVGSNGWQPKYSIAGNMSIPCRRCHYSAPALRRCCSGSCCRCC